MFVANFVSMPAFGQYVHSGEIHPGPAFPFLSSIIVDTNEHTNITMS